MPNSLSVAKVLQRPCLYMRPRAPNFDNFPFQGCPKPVLRPLNVGRAYAFSSDKLRDRFFGTWATRSYAWKSVTFTSSIFPG